MKAAPADLHGGLRARVCSVLTTALRADNTAIQAAVDQAGALDPYTADFVRDSRRLILACAAAVSAVLDLHTPTPHGDVESRCRGCGYPECRTLGRVLHVLDAYSAHPGQVDRAEAWRRADSYINQSGERSALLVSIDAFEEGFAARAFNAAGKQAGAVLIVDRRTGRLTRWPDMPRDALIEHYRRYLRGRL